MWYAHKPFIFPTQAQHVLFLNEKQNPYWKVMAHMEPWSSHLMLDRFAKSSGIDANATWLHTPMTMSPTTQGASLVGSELLLKELVFVNETFREKRSRFINEDLVVHPNGVNKIMYTFFQSHFKITFSINYIVCRWCDILAYNKIEGWSYLSLITIPK